MRKSLNHNFNKMNEIQMKLSEDARITNEAINMQLLNVNLIENAVTGYAFFIIDEKISENLVNSYHIDRNLLSKMLGEEIYDNEMLCRLLLMVEENPKELTGNYFFKRALVKHKPNLQVMLETKIENYDSYR